MAPSSILKASISLTLLSSSSRTHVIRLGPPRQSRLMSPSRVPNLITTAKPFLLCRFQRLGQPPSLGAVILPATLMQPQDSESRQELLSPPLPRWLMPPCWALCPPQVSDSKFSELSAPVSLAPPPCKYLDVPSVPSPGLLLSSRPLCLCPHFLRPRLAAGYNPPPSVISLQMPGM